MERIIIELSGLPGSGKSTLLNNLNDENRKDLSSEAVFYSTVLGSKFRIVASLLYCFIGGLGTGFGLMYYCVRMAMPGVRKKALKKVFKLFRYKGLIKMAKQDYILSEGYVQAVLEIMDFFKTVNDHNCEKLKRYVIAEVSHMSCLYFVLISSSMETSLTRVSLRTKSFNTIDKMSESERRQFYAKRSMNTVLLHSWIQEASLKGRVFMIDAEQSLEHNSQQLNSITVVIKNEKK